MPCQERVRDTIRIVCFAAESELDSTQIQVATPPKPESMRPKRTNVWQETFSPQMNSNMRHMSADYYDSPPSGEKKKTVWDHIVKAETIRHAAFDHFDTNSELSLLSSV